LSNTQLAPLSTFAADESNLATTLTFESGYDVRFVEQLPRGLSRDDVLAHDNNAYTPGTGDIRGAAAVHQFTRFAASDVGPKLVAILGAVTGVSTQVV
jgi:hypothetical protein